MKLNSNTVILESNTLSDLINITEEIAKKENIFNVGEASITLDPTKGIIDFTTIDMED